MQLQIHEYAHKLPNISDKNSHDHIGYMLNLIDKANLYQLDEQILALIDSFCANNSYSYPEAFLKYYK